MILKFILGSDFLPPPCRITLFETQNSITNTLNSPHPNMVPFLLISVLVIVSTQLPKPKPWALSSTIPLLPCILFCPSNSQNTPTFHPYCTATVQALVVSQLDCCSNFPNGLLMSTSVYSPNFQKCRCGHVIKPTIHQLKNIQWFSLALRMKYKLLRKT